MTAPTDFTGKVIGGYRLERLIGSGATGAVYEAAQRETGQKAALKVLPAALFPGRALVERFSQELKLLARLRNPGIVKVYDAGKIREGGLYVVMELLEGKTLAQLLAAAPGGLAVSEALRLSEGICSVLEATHGVGVMHRNLRPTNIFLIKSGKRLQAKLLDFGVNPVAPTPGHHDYRAPEQLRPLPINEGADLFCLGLTLYEMLTGKKVSYEDDPPPAPSTHRRELSAAVDGLVLELLAKFPEGRPASAKRVREACAALRADLPRSAADPFQSFTPRPSRPPPEPDPKTEIPKELLRGGRAPHVDETKTEIPAELLRPAPPRSSPAAPRSSPRAPVPSRPAAPASAFDEVTHAAPLGDDVPTRVQPIVAAPLQARPSANRAPPPPPEPTQQARPSGQKAEVRESTVQVSPSMEVPAARAKASAPRPAPPITDPGLAGGKPLGEGLPENTESRAARRRAFKPPPDAEQVERRQSRKRVTAWVLGSVAMAGIVWLETRPIRHYGPVAGDPTQQAGPRDPGVKTPSTHDEFDPSAPVAPDEFDPSKPDPAPANDELAAPKEKRGGAKPKGGKRGR